MRKTNIILIVSILHLLFPFVLSFNPEGGFMCVDDTQEPSVFFITKEEAKECQRCPCKNIYVDCLVGQDNYGNIL